MANKKIIGNNVVVVDSANPGIKHIMLRGADETICGESSANMILYKPDITVGFSENRVLGSNFCGNCVQVLLKSEAF